MTKHPVFCILAVLLAVSTTASAQTEDALDGRVERMEERLGDLAQSLEGLLKTLSARQQGRPTPAAPIPLADAAVPISESVLKVLSADRFEGLADGGSRVTGDGGPELPVARGGDEFGERISNLQQRLEVLIGMACQRQVGRASTVLGPSPEDEARLAELAARVAALVSVLAESSVRGPADDPPHASSGIREFGDPSVLERREPPSAAPDIAGPQDHPAAAAPRQEPVLAPIPRVLSSRWKEKLDRHVPLMNEADFFHNYSNPRLVTSGWILNSNGLIVARINDRQEHLVLALRSQPNFVHVWRDGALLYGDRCRFAHSAAEAYGLGDPCPKAFAR